jgi:hypothetical protein
MVIRRRFFHDDIPNNVWKILHKRMNAAVPEGRPGGGSRTISAFHEMVPSPISIVAQHGGCFARERLHSKRRIVTLFGKKIPAILLRDLPNPFPKTPDLVP